MLVGYDDNLVDVAVHAELRLEHLRSDVLAVARLEKVLDALRHEEFAVLHVAGIACVEPALLVYRHSCYLGFAIVAFRDGIAFEENLVVLAELHLHTIKRTTDGTERNSLIPAVARHGGSALGESIARNHQNACRANKLLDDRRNGSSGSGEEVVSLQSQGLQEQSDDCLLVEEIAHLQGKRWHEASHLVIDIVGLADAKRVFEHPALYGRGRVHLLLYAAIHFLPEPRHSTHTRRMHFAKALQDVGRTTVDSQRAARLDAEIRPASFEDMREGQEVHDEVLVGKRQSTYVTSESGIIHLVRQHDTLADARRSAGVEDVGQVVFLHFGCELLYLFAMVFPIGKCQKLIEIKAHIVLRVFLYGRVEDDELPHGLLNLEYAVGCVVLVLLADKDVANLGVAHHVLHLGLACRSIERDGDGPDAISTEVHEHAFGHVLRENSDVFLHPDTQFEQRS